MATEGMTEEKMTAKMFQPKYDQVKNLTVFWGTFTICLSLIRSLREASSSRIDRSNLKQEKAINWISTKS